MLRFLRKVAVATGISKHGVSPIKAEPLKLSIRRTRSVPSNLRRVANRPANRPVNESAHNVFVMTYTFYIVSEGFYCRGAPHSGHAETFES